MVGFSRAMQQSLEALRNAENARAIPGRQRLELMQRHLVELLNHLEAREGYSLFVGVRQQCSSRRERAVAVPIRRTRARRARRA